MKTQEQISVADATVKHLQDYIELARTQKKLKTKEALDLTEQTLNNCVENANEKIKKL